MNGKRSVSRSCSLRSRAARATASLGSLRGLVGNLASARPLAREFYARHALEVAPELLNKVLVAPDGRAGRIVEVEAYRGADDLGSHGHRGRTRRNATMFGPPGQLYVYFTYGMHWCANVVAETDGVAAAVLLRALTPLEGLDAMYAARGPVARRDRDLCSGPAKLTQALGIDSAFDGANLVIGDRGVTVLDDGQPPPTDPAVSTRIGLTAGADLPWRFCVAGVPDLSRR